MCAAEMMNPTATPRPTTPGAPLVSRVNALLTAWSRKSAPTMNALAGAAVIRHHSRGSGDSDVPRNNLAVKTTSATVSTVAES